MTLGGFLAMLVSVGGTTFFFGWCIWRILKPPGFTDKVHGVLDTEREIEDAERQSRKK
jgi:hypothetical protein